MTVAAMSSLAFVTVCAAIKHLINYGAGHLLAGAAVSCNAGSNDLVFAPTWTADRCNTRWGWLRAVARSDVVARVVSGISVVNFIESFCVI